MLAGPGPLEDWVSATRRNSLHGNQRINEQNQSTVIRPEYRTSAGRQHTQPSTAQPQETYQKEIMAIVTIKTYIYRPVLTECIIRPHAPEQSTDESKSCPFLGINGMTCRPGHVKEDDTMSPQAWKPSSCQVRVRTRVFFVKSNWSAANQACLAVPLFKLTFQIEILQQRVCQSPGHDQLSLEYWNYEQDIRAELGNCNSTQNMVIR